MEYYAGIGSRATPDDVLLKMRRIARWLAGSGYTLRSGGAEGADSAFENGCDSVGGRKQIFLPWRGFNHNDSIFYTPPDEAFLLAKSVHPAWSRLSNSVMKLMARNCQQVLGTDLKSPSRFLVLWTPNGEAVGGTAQAIRLAEKFNIKYFNLYHKDAASNLVDFVKGE